jgi:hypothetical protein
MEDTMTLRELDRFLEESGTRGANLVKELGKRTPHMEALQSAIGLELLRYKISKLNVLFMKVYDETATPQEVADFRCIKRELEFEAGKIKEYLKLQGEIALKR